MSSPVEESNGTSEIASPHTVQAKAACTMPLVGRASLQRRYCTVQIPNLFM